MNEEEQIPETEKNRFKAIVLVFLIISIVIPFTFLSLVLITEEHGEQFLTYKEFHENYHSMQLEDGDAVVIRDVFSNIWYNQSTGFTYMAFESMDETRTAPWGYDAGIPEDSVCGTRWKSNLRYSRTPIRRGILYLLRISRKSRGFKEDMVLYGLKARAKVR